MEIISNVKYLSYRVIYLIEIYNFCTKLISILIHMKQPRVLKNMLST
jgi:hypothetical protein